MSRAPATASRGTSRWSWPPSSRSSCSHSDPMRTSRGERGERGERRWPMAVAVLLTGVLRVTLPPALRLRDPPWVLLVLLISLTAALMIGDPGRIDRTTPWMRVVTDILIASISIANGVSATRLVVDIIAGTSFTQSARILLGCGAVIWVTNVIAFGLWYWDLDRGGAAARVAGSTISPAFVFPEMTHAEHVRDGWVPTFVDYLFLSFNTAMAFSPTDVAAIKPWAKLMMMAEEAVSLAVGVLVVARAINILS